MENNNYIKNVVVVALKLLLVCAVVAGVVSFVYTATLDAYNENIERETLQSMATIFGAGENDEISLATFEGRTPIIIPHAGRYPSNAPPAAKTAQPVHRRSKRSFLRRFSFRFPLNSFQI